MSGMTSGKDAERARLPSLLGVADVERGDGQRDGTRTGKGVVLALDVERLRGSEVSRDEDGAAASGASSMVGGGVGVGQRLVVARGWDSGGSHGCEDGPAMAFSGHGSDVSYTTPAGSCWYVVCSALTSWACHCGGTAVVFTDALAVLLEVGKASLLGVSLDEVGRSCGAALSARGSECRCWCCSGEEGRWFGSMMVMI